MVGKIPDYFYTEFEFSKYDKKVLKCLEGQFPTTCKYYLSTNTVRIILNKETCNKCPYREQCRPKFHKKKSSKTISHKTVLRARQLRYMKTSEFKDFAKNRNGVESIPSTLRRKYEVDRIPVRGLLCTIMLEE
ncbi:MAG TPA: hypothetical protein GXZ66_06245 [Clostridiaceae bacterium]|nr:hypothetical protein [Clostridiaceae bacterium]